MRTTQLSFFERPYPSANVVLLLGDAPILVDSGFGSDTTALIHWLESQGVVPDQLALVVNTHYHSDHVGGNHLLQTQFGCRIAAHALEAEAVNARHIEACAARWLRQPVEQYYVDQPLIDGEVLCTGNVAWQVLHTPGHTRGHISLFDQQSRILIGGDVVHENDVGWLNSWLEGADSVDVALSTLARLEQLAPAIVLPGHGHPITDVPVALHKARTRLERWRHDAEGAAWHAAKRIFAFALMINDGIADTAVAAYLESSPWLMEMAATPFGVDQETMQRLVVEEMLRSGAATVRAGQMMAVGEHIPPTRGWNSSPVLPSEWTSRVNPVPHRPHHAL